MTRGGNAPLQRSGERPGVTDREDALWYKDAVIYQLHVRAFHDSDGDGVGDFRGLVQKLDYLQDLGVTALWLLPFYPSPLKDDGYDIADYTGVHSSYGTLRDFQVFLREAHSRGLRVITELVLNHTSDQHPWFQRARQARPASRARDYYVWSDTPDRYQGTRIIFQDFESSNWAWDPVARAYYWHRFYSHQPDLNFDNPEVRRAIFQAVDFWLGMDVDGLRLDAVPYLFEREGTSCENLPETHAFLKDLRRHVDESFSSRMLLAEANQWPEDARAYFGDGDECHAAFHFPLMPRLFMAVHMEDRFPVVDILQQTPAIPDSCQWAVFLRNHDELTLEMVTDEDRDYMYRVYAQDAQARVNLGIRRRLAPLLGNNRRRIELMNGLLFSLPGSPVIYYGDEIGMGDNIYVGDRNGVRTPMQWNGDRNAGFSRANPHRLYLPVILEPEYHYGTVNVEAQQNNPHSLLWWMKRLIALRRRYRAFGRGTIELLQPANRKVLAFIRRYDEETILVVANLSRFVQYAELDLSAYKNMVPVELFGRSEFPKVGGSPFFITLGPHAFYWFALEPQRAAQSAPNTSPQVAQLPVLTLIGSRDDLIHGQSRSAVEAILPIYLRSQRWFAGKARPIQSARITDSISTPCEGLDLEARVLLVKVVYLEGEPETYLFPVAIGSGEVADRVRSEFPQSIVARVQFQGQAEEGVLFEPLADKSFAAMLLESISRRRRFKGSVGELVASPTQALRTLNVGPAQSVEPAVVKSEQSNSSIVYGDKLILKLFRRPDPGVNPDLEIGRFLTERAPSVHTPPVAGFLEYRSEGAESMTLGVLQVFVPNEGDAWHYTLDSLTSYFDRVLAQSSVDLENIPDTSGPLVALCQQDPPALATDLIGPFLQSSELLGRRTGELHVALASGLDDRDFQPEPFTPLHQRALYQSMRALAGQAFSLLRRRLSSLHDGVQQDARRALELEPSVLQRFQTIVNREMSGMRIRCHSDYHLGQILCTGNDFVIIDFEGEPTRPLSERRLKRPPLRDVAGMLRSFDYAACAALLHQTEVGAVHPEQLSEMRRWACLWQTWVSAAFLKSYLHAVSDMPILPRTPEELQRLMDALILEKTIYELAYELNNRPPWVQIPVRGILEQLDGA